MRTIVWMTVGVLGMASGAASVEAQGATVPLGAPDRVFGDMTPLHRIRDVAVSGSRVIVITAPEPAVHVFGLPGDGEARSWGSEGEAPGELRNPVAVAVAGDSIHVLDLVPGRNRVTTYDPSGSLVGTREVEGPALAHDLARLGARLVVEGSEFGADLRLVSLLGEAGDPVLSFRVPEGVEVRAESGPMRSLTLTPPFSPVPRWTALPTGELAWWPGSGRRIEVRSPDGERRRFITLPAGEIPVAPADRSAWLARRFSPAEELFGVRDPYSGIRAEAEESLPFPAAFPPVLELKADPLGGVWVLRAWMAGGQLWTRFGADGGPPLSLVTGDGREVLAFGEGVVAVKSVDGLGVERVEIHRWDEGAREEAR